MIKVCKEILRCYIDRDQKNWAVLLEDAVQCINNSINIESGFSPNEVYYGRQHFRPVDLQYGKVVSFPSVRAFLADGEYKRAIATEVVREAIVRFSKQFNAKTPVLVIDPRIVPGSKVFVNADYLTPPHLRNRPSKKLGVKRAGPFEVLARVSDTGFRLSMPGYKVHTVFHARSLTPYEEGLDLEIRAAQSKPDHIQPESGREMWSVKELASRMRRGRKHFYFVVYDGCDSSEGEYVLREDLLEDCPDLVREFDSKNPIQPVKTARVKAVKQSAPPSKAGNRRSTRLATSAP